MRKLWLALVVSFSAFLGRASAADLDLTGVNDDVASSVIVSRWLSDLGYSPELETGGPNTGSGRYSLGADTKLADKARIWYQADLVTA